MSDCTEFFPGSRRREICDGQSELPIETANQYRVMWGKEPFALGADGKTYTLKESSGVVVRVLPRTDATATGAACCGGNNRAPVPIRKMVDGTGVGGRLIEMFKAAGFESCQACYDLAARMNEWGTDGCVTNLSVIVADILPRALAWESSKVGWWAKFLPEAVTEAAIKLMVESAIATAKPLEWTTEAPAVTGPRQRPRVVPTAPAVSIQTDRKIGIVTQPAEVAKQDGWWNDADVQQQHRDKATRFIQTIPRYPDHFEGRGIVVTGGGKYFVSAYITIRVIRHVGCKLPIELWYLDGEMDDEMVDMVAEHGVTCHNASELARGTGYFLEHWWKGWQLKAFALLHSSFREVLMLDADSYPVRDPSFVFDWPEYINTGAIIWPDIGSSARLFPPLAARVLGVPQFTEAAAESGQLVFNKEQTWQALCLAKHLNADAIFTYHIVYGDKDTFPVAMHRLGLPYSRMNTKCRFNGPGIQQLDQNGETLFNHRIHDKFRIFNTRFDSTSQRGVSHQFATGWLHEHFCHDVLKELSKKWGN